MRSCKFIPEHPRITTSVVSLIKLQFLQNLRILHFSHSHFVSYLTFRDHSVIKGNCKSVHFLSKYLLLANIMVLFFINTEIVLILLQTFSTLCTLHVGRITEETFSLSLKRNSDLGIKKL